MHYPPKGVFLQIQLGARKANSWIYFFLRLTILLAYLLSFNALNLDSANNGKPVNNFLFS